MPAEGKQRGRAIILTSSRPREIALLTTMPTVWFPSLLGASVCTYVLCICMRTWIHNAIYAVVCCRFRNTSIHQHLTFPNFREQPQILLPLISEYQDTKSLVEWNNLLQRRNIITYAFIHTSKKHNHCKWGHLGSTSFCYDHKCILQSYLLGTLQVGPILFCAFKPNSFRLQDKTSVATKCNGLFGFLLQHG